MGYANLIQADNFAIGLLDLLQLGEEIPEARLGNDIVRGEDAHTVELGRRVGVGGQVAPDDLVLLQATCCAQQNQRCLTEASYIPIDIVCPWRESHPILSQLLSVHRNFASGGQDDVRVSGGEYLTHLRGC